MLTASIPSRSAMATPAAAMSGRRSRAAGRERAGVAASAPFRAIAGIVAEAGVHCMRTMYATQGGNVPDGPARTASAVSGVNHLALTSGDIDRLADFYVGVFGAELLARSEGVPRKCVIRLAPGTSLHVFEVGFDEARKPDDEP